MSALLQSLEHIRGLIKDAGGVPNSTYYRARRAILALEEINSQPMPVEEGSNYRITMTNGREVTVWVNKSTTVFAVAKREMIEISSFVKID